MRTAYLDLELALKTDSRSALAAQLRLRQAVDALERIVDDDKWPLPKYREMLFIY